MTETTSDTIAETIDHRAPYRVRHELHRRLLTVRQVQRLSPHMLRITLGGDDLQGFTSLGFDDHVKLIFADPATGQTALSTDGPRPPMRDYTPRHFDAVAQTLEIDFALHDAGPATQWAEQATPGQQIGVGGPRGSLVIPLAFDGYLLVGDDTALPAIARRLAELPAGAPVVVLAEVDAQGNPVDVRVVERSGERDLDRAAVNAVRQWRFEPAMRNGKAIATSVKVPVDFKPI